MKTVITGGAGRLRQMKGASVFPGHASRNPQKEMSSAAPYPGHPPAARQAGEIGPAGFTRRKEGHPA